jgi:tripartite-type tricarboxylate transporter receptor subunit TctC
MALMQRAADVKFVHVPYKGAGASKVAMVGGEVSLLFTAPGAALPQVKAGRLRSSGSICRMK